VFFGASFGSGAIIAVLLEKIKIFILRKKI